MKIQAMRRLLPRGGYEATMIVHEIAIHKDFPCCL